MRKKLLVIVVGLVVLATIFVSGCNQKTNTFSKFGISFEYPANMEVEENGILSSQANERSGEIILESTGSPFRVIEIRWIKKEDEDKASLRGLLDSLLANYTVVAKKGQREATHAGHAVIEQRYVLVERFGFICSRGIWWCDSSKRTFIITSVRGAGDAGVEIGTTGEVEMPARNKDPAYNDYRGILSTFQCH